MARSRQSHLVESYVALISSRGPSVHELKVAISAAECGAAAQQFRCNYDTKNTTEAVTEPQWSELKCFITIRVKIRFYPVADNHHIEFLTQQI